jgi:hypothetical protein
MRRRAGLRPSVDGRPAGALPGRAGAGVARGELRDAAASSRRPTPAAGRSDTWPTRPRRGSIAPGRAPVHAPGDAPGVVRALRRAGSGAPLEAADPADVRAAATARWRPTWTPAEHAHGIGEVRERIAVGETFQCNLIVRMSGCATGGSPPPVPGPGGGPARRLQRPISTSAVSPWPAPTPSRSSSAAATRCCPAP